MYFVILFQKLDIKRKQKKSSTTAKKQEQIVLKSQQFTAWVREGPYFAIQDKKRDSRKKETSLKPVSLLFKLNT